MIQHRYSTNERQQIPSKDYRLGMLPKNSLDEVTGAFAPISLQEMDSVALLNRVDTKFVLSTSQLITVLDNLRFRYQILSIDHQRIHHYRTLYFDTQGFELYHDHVTGRSEIYKVRSREYLDTQLSFFEIKHKNHKRRTEKSRLPLLSHSECLDRKIDDFLHGFIPFSSHDLEPKLWNTFRRITLVSKAASERLTIDLDLCFFNEQQVLNLEGIAIAEVKQDQFSKDSAFISEMRRQGIRRTGFSKYCFGVSQLYSTVKKNSQKERALMIEKLQHRGQDHVRFS